MISRKFLIVPRQRRLNGKYFKRQAVIAAPGIIKLIFDFRLMIINNESNMPSNNAVAVAGHFP